MGEKKGVVVSIIHDPKTGQTFETGAKSLPKIHCDFTGLTGEELREEHLGARFLLCAALSCFTNTFANNLLSQGAEVKSIRTSSTIQKEMDDLRRTRYTRIQINLEVEMNSKDKAIFEKVRSNMLHGSLVTYSLGEGIEVDYEISQV